MNGELRILDDVPAAYAEIVAERIEGVLAQRELDQQPFRLALSGGRSGAACARALSLREDLDWQHLVCYFVDERCVDPSSSDANLKILGDAFGERLQQFGLVLPMSCEKGAEFYDAEVAAVTRFDLIQLGLGPDGHTASLFPDSPALSAPADRLVVMNEDPSGNNAHQRMTFTLSAIARGDLVVFTVIGDAQADVLARLLDGEDLPANRVTAKEVIWLVDRSAGTKIKGRAAKEMA